MAESKSRPKTIDQVAHLRVKKDQNLSFTALAAGTVAISKENINSSFQSLKIFIKNEHATESVVYTVRASCVEEPNSDLTTTDWVDAKTITVAASSTVSQTIRMTGYLWYGVRAVASGDTSLDQTVIASFTNTPPEELAAAALDSDSLVFVGKNGNDSNGGRNSEDPLLTFGQALTLAATLSPSSSNIITIVCFDGGIYVESIITVAFVNIWAPNAILSNSSGNAVTLVSDVSITFAKIVNTVSGSCITRSDIAGTSFSNVGIIDAQGPSIGLTFSGTTKNPQWVHCGTKILLETGAGIFGITGGNSHFHVTVEDIYVGGNGGICVIHSGTGELLLVAHHISEKPGTTPTTTTGIAVSVGKCIVKVNDLHCDTSYNISSGTLSGYIGIVGGTTNISGTGVVDVVTPKGVYGEIYVANNATPLNFTVLNQWEQFVNFDTDGASSETTPDHTNDHITIKQTGLYMVTISVSFSGSTNDTFELMAQKNNGATLHNNVYSQRKIGSGGDVGHSSASGIISLTLGDTLEFWMRCTNTATANITAVHASLSIRRVG